MNKQEIDIHVLQSKIEGLETRIQFLEKNWVHWTKDTKETGQKLMVALSELLENEASGRVVPEINKNAPVGF